MFIKIRKNISTRSYDFEPHRTFIIDEKEHIHYFLKGTKSKLWEYLVQTSGYDKIKAFAKTLGFESSLEPFLKELKAKNLIDTDLDIKETEAIREFIDFSVSQGGMGFYHYSQKADNLIYKAGLMNELYLQLTNKCNLSCKHCFCPQDTKSREISFETAKEIINQAYDLGINRIRLSGGEAACARSFMKTVDYIREKHLSFSFVTNGQILYDDKKLFDKIVNSYPDNIKISLYGMDEDIHDFITGVKGSCYKTLNVIKRLRENNIFVDISSPQFKLNKGSGKAIKEFADKIGAGCGVGVRFINNPERKNGHLRFNKDEIEEFYLSNPELLHQKNMVKKRNTSGIVCEAGFFLLNVMPNLDITPCAFWNFKLGNFQDNSLSDIWHNVIPEFQKKYMAENLTECNKEPYCEYCHYCPIHSSFSNGFMKKADTLCEDAIAHYNAAKKAEGVQTGLNHSND